MKLIPLECPKCGAQLQVNPALTHTICNYCGHHFIIDDEAKKVDVRIQNAQQAGYDFERGRIRAQSAGPNSQLAQEVKELIEPLSQLHETTMQTVTLKKQIEDAKKSQKNLKIALYIAPAGWSLLCFMSAFSSDNPLSTLGYGLLLSGIIALVLFLMMYGSKATFETSSKKYNEAIKKIAALKTALKKYDVDLIPPDYRYRQALNFIYTALVNQRAMNIQQAVNLYEDELRNNRIEDLQKQQLEELKKIKATGKYNAYVNTLNLLNKK